MNESTIINNYLKKLAIHNNSSLNLNDDVFFDRSKKIVISVDTYFEGLHFIDFKKPYYTVVFHPDTINFNERKREISNRNIKCR